MEGWKTFFVGDKCLAIKNVSLRFCGISTKNAGCLEHENHGPKLTEWIHSKAPMINCDP